MLVPKYDLEDATPTCVVSVLQTYNISNCTLTIIHFTVIFKIRMKLPMMKFKGKIII